MALGQKGVRVYLFLFALGVYSFKGHLCFFLKHSSGFCVRSTVTPELSIASAKIWYLELTNQCTGAAAQFRFLNNGVLNHVSSTGCVLPLNGKSAVPRDGSKLVVVNGKIDCENKTGQAYTLTSMDTLRHSSGKCVEPHTSFQMIPTSGAKLEYTSRCNTTNQRFIFGSVTCEGRRTSDINCPSFQVIVITRANYGGFGNLKACDYKGSYRCLLPASLCHVKRMCDGRPTCEIDVTTDEFKEDPCPGMSKYLYLEYKCVNKSDFRKENVQVQSVRLASQVKPGEGFVEVLEDSQPGVWQRLCITKTIGATFCRSLGYSGYRTPGIWSKTRKDDGTPIIYGDVYCNKKEDNVSSCCIAKSTASENRCTIMAVACTVCSEPILTGKNRPHFTFLASNSIPGYTADKATFSSNHSWCGVRIGDYLKIDLGQKYLISQLAILGDGSRERWVTSYEFSYSTDKSKWFQGNVKGRKLLTGISENNGKLSTSIFDSLVIARFINIIPKTWNREPCMRLEICGHQLLPDAPENITLTSVGPWSAVVTWGPPSETGDGLFTNYLILLTTQEKIVLRNLSKVERLHVDILKPYTQYTFTIQAGNKHGYGRKTEVSFTTKSAAPDGPPTNIKIITVSATSLSVSWNPPSINQRNGVISGYEMCLASVESDEECDRVIRTKNSNTRASDLKTATMYKVMILARNDAGFGDYSVEYFKMTNGDAPTCNLSTITRKTFVINLQEPQKEIRFCQIIAMELPSDDSDPKELLHSRDPVTYLEAFDTTPPTPYIAAEFNISDFEDYKEFTVGDGKLFPALIKQTWNDEAVQKYFNGPLSPGTTYTVVQKFYSEKELLYFTEFLSPVKTIGQESFDKFKLKVLLTKKLQLPLREKKPTGESVLVLPQTKSLTKIGMSDSGSSSDKFKAPFIIVIVLLVLIMLVAVMFALLLFRKQQQRGENENIQTTAEQSTPAETIPMNQTENTNQEAVA